LIVLLWCAIAWSAGSVGTFSQSGSGGDEILSASEKKAERARQLRDRREAAAKARREAAGKAKAKREERAKRAKLDAEARKQAAAEIAQAKRQARAELAALDTKAPAEQIARQREEIEARFRLAVAKTKMKLRHYKEKVLLERLDLPTDTSQRLTVKELRIGGNTLVSTADLFDSMPLVYNASDQPLEKAEPDLLYDFSVLSEIIIEPGQPREVSARTIQGFTQYILSVYQSRNYAGIYVYVPEGAMSGATELRDGLLFVQILELSVSDIEVTSYDPEHNKVETPHLRSSVVKDWSPVKVGQVANQKELDDFVSLLNLNPDRYVSAVVSRGTEPNTLSLGYDIYEAEPWHFYIQADNGGTRQRQWTPRIGLINTSLTGVDDRFSAMYQAPWESGIEDNYFLFGSYDFPVFTPRLRLNLYAGYNEFDITPEGGAFNFLGRGSFLGGILRYNVLQTGGWFFDVTGSLGHERSRITPSLFPAMASDVEMDLFGVGVDLYQSDDMSDTSLSFNRLENIEGSSQRTFSAARQNADRDFIIYSFSAAHSRYLDPNKVQRLGGSFRLIDPGERLVPAKMTTFGGLYSVRGYDEDEIVADGGIVVSAQYEFDLIKYDASKNASEAEEDSDLAEAQKPLLRKLAPLGFVDFGRAKIEDSVSGEKGVQELCSAGLGTIFEVGDNFSGALYYGWALRETDETDEGDGRFNISLILRW
jgi:hemolysin activation/secretion protein